MAYRQETRAGGFFGGRTTNAVESARLPAGPFDVSPTHSENTATTLSDALITGLLIVYPVVATVVAVIVGLFLAGPLA
jgi:hypothetical protein